jgi:hypothetical protein
MMCNKKICLLSFLIASLISIASHGQKFTLGLKAGGLINWAGFGDKDQKDTFATKITYGYTAGFQIGFPLKKDFTFLAEGAFTRKGRSLTFNDNRWENKSVYHFAEATMLLRKSYHFQLRKNVPSEWFFVLGPEVSYWINSRGRIIVSKPGYPYAGIFDKAPDGNFNNMYYNDVNRYLFSLVVGIGFKAPLKSNQHICADLRFVSGHTFLGKRNSSHIEILGFEDTLLTNLKSVNLTVTYSFDFDVKESRKGKSTLKKSLKRTR